MSRSRRNQKIIRRGIALISRGLLHELNAIISRKRVQRRWWVKPWVSRRTNLGASSTLLREWAEENPEVYRNHLRMNEEQFAYLLDKVTPLIRKKDTWFREALSPKIKLQMTLRYLATGDNIGTLSASIEEYAFSRRTEYWKSQDRKFCDFCQCWIADNKPSIQSHENGKRHKENVAKKLSAMSKKSVQLHKESIEIDKDMKKMEDAAMKAYLNDMKSNPDFTSQQIIQTLEERGELHRLEEIEDKKKSPPPGPNQKPKNRNKDLKVDRSSAASSGNEKRTLWVQMTSDEGHTYYWNTESNESSWEVPAEGCKSMADYQSEMKAAQTKADEMKEELRAFKAREEMKKLVANVEEAEDEEASDEGASVMGPAPKPDPYGGWTTVIREVPKKIDLQLPKTEGAPVYIPAVRESRVGLKEKKLEFLDADDVPTTFKKRKLGFKGNIRRRTGDDSD